MCIRDSLCMFLESQGLDTIKGTGIKCSKLNAVRMFNGMIPSYLGVVNTIVGDQEKTRRLMKDNEAKRVYATQKLNQTDDLLELDYTLHFMKFFHEQWIKLTQQMMRDGFAQEISIYTQLLILGIVILILFLVVLWRRNYNKIKFQSFEVNKFIVIIPIQIIRENQYIKVFLKRHMKLNAFSFQWGVTLTTITLSLILTLTRVFSLKLIFLTLKLEESVVILLTQNAHGTRQSFNYLFMKTHVAFRDHDLSLIHI
eukprot:TRINITY_DN2998_c0_g1_i2.p1 TRINITY_DN2998_c0_g1~~TRINITY_DN2998_c0_g1_i2.p1  ORF type:complete len:255 (-),score=37.36 TRINITY_DN2998_c0_g1_i2:61-825(-)